MIRPTFRLHEQQTPSKSFQTFLDKFSVPHKRPTLHIGRAAYFEGKSCPSCGHGEDGIEDNGCTGSELTYLCTSCSHQWDAYLYAPESEND